MCTLGTSGLAGLVFLTEGAGGSPSGGLAFRTSLPTSPPTGPQGWQNRERLPVRGQARHARGAWLWRPPTLKRGGPLRVTRSCPQRRQKQSLVLPLPPLVTQLHTQSRVVRKAEKACPGGTKSSGEKHRRPKQPQGSAAGPGMGRLFPEQLWGLCSQPWGSGKPAQGGRTVER